MAADIFGELCDAARATTRIKLLAGPVNFVTRDPGVVASAIAPIQILSGGRAICGVARGGSAVALADRRPQHHADLARDVMLVRRSLDRETVRSAPARVGSNGSASSRTPRSLSSWSAADRVPSRSPPRPRTVSASASGRTPSASAGRWPSSPRHSRTRGEHVPPCASAHTCPSRWPTPAPRAVPPFDSAWPGGRTYRAFRQRPRRTTRNHAPRRPAQAEVDPSTRSRLTRAACARGQRPSSGSLVKRRMLFSNSPKVLHTASRSMWRCTVRSCTSVYMSTVSFARPSASAWIVMR